MHKFVEVVFVARTKVDKGLDGLIGICGNFLTLTGFDGFDCVVGEDSKVSNTVVDVRRLVHADKRFVKDGEEVTEELESRGLQDCQQVFLYFVPYAYLFDDLKHHELVSLP